MPNMKPQPAPIPAGLKSLMWFPVIIPSNFKPLMIVKRAGKVCVCQNEKDGFKPKWGGGFAALRGNNYHKAIDIMAPIGAAVVAVDDGQVLHDVTIVKRVGGKVTKIKTPGVAFTPIGGHNVWVRHSWGTSYYAHLHEAPSVVPGQKITGGVKLGIVGLSGNATGGCPHLHFTAEDIAGRKFDPQALLKDAYERDEWNDDVVIERYKRQSGVIQETP